MLQLPSYKQMTVGMKRLAELFADESDHDATFYGFSDTELMETVLDPDHQVQPEISPREQQKATPEPSATPQPSRLRISFNFSPSIRQPTSCDAEEEEKMTAKKGVKQPRKTNRTKKESAMKFEDEETAVSPLSPSEERGSDSNEDVSDHFLVKREQNIKANKAMLAQLMADLQKLPEGEGLLKQTGKRKTKERNYHPSHSSLTRVEFRRYPERASRRKTRSMMREGQDPSPPDEADVELSLEEELLQVRRAPHRRSTPRPNRTKPHIIRPVEDIKENELELVADNMTDKVHNSVSISPKILSQRDSELFSNMGSTCHQCRQKTVDTKTCCRSEDCRGIQGQFCGPCLRNRYGEDVRKALLDPRWKCPPCRGICNCSFCRQREGHCPTGILFPLAQYHGFSDVHSYLTSLRNKLKGEEIVEM